jgi:hypothetical protein
MKIIAVSGATLTDCRDLPSPARASSLARLKTAYGSPFMPRSSRPRSNEGYCHAPA